MGGKQSKSDDRVVNGFRNRSKTSGLGEHVITNNDQYFKKGSFQHKPKKTDASRFDIDFDDLDFKSIKTPSKSQDTHSQFPEQCLASSELLDQTQLSQNRGVAQKTTSLGNLSVSNNDTQLEPNSCILKTKQVDQDIQLSKESSMDSTIESILGFSSFAYHLSKISMDIFGDRYHKPFLCKETQNAEPTDKAPVSALEVQPSPRQKPFQSLRRSFRGPQGTQIQHFKSQLKTMISDGNPKKTYCDLKQIGYGGFSTVYKASKKVTKEIVVIKKMKLKSLIQYPLMIMNELQALTDCTHPNIVSHHDSFLLKDKVWLTMEYVDGGDLHELVQRIPLTEDLIAAIVQQSLEGLAFIHSKGFIHCDIKSHNILLNTEGRVKIADFGLVTKATAGQPIKRNYLCGTLHWMSPEMTNSETIDSKIDIWALGIVCVEMLDKVPPTAYLPKSLAMCYISGGVVTLRKPELLSYYMHDFLYERCLVKNPNERQSAEQLLEHNFVKSAASVEHLGKVVKLALTKEPMPSYTKPHTNLAMTAT